MMPLLAVSRESEDSIDDALTPALSHFSGRGLG
jgi:hypothetical protein